MMADDLDEFIDDQKAKLAQDKAKLESDPPYMEMRSKESEKLSETGKTFISMAKENIPPNSQQNIPLADYGLSLPLGEDYERKKHKLKEELRQDYKRYLSQGISQAKRKKSYLTTGEVDPYTRGLSLPIDERRSAKERLRLERNKEYNQYLRDKEEWNERLRKLGKKKSENETGRNKNPVAVPRRQPELSAEAQPCDMGTDPPKKDAFTSTEEMLSKRWLEEDWYHKLDEAELKSQLSNKRLDEVLDVPSQRHRGFVSQSVIPGRMHHRLDEDRDFARRYYRMDYDSQTTEEIDRGLRCKTAYDRKLPRVFYSGRSPIQITSSDNQQGKLAAEMPFSAGLALGGQDQELLQRKKEKYRQELIEQIAEQQRNKRREKELDLSVAASGAQDPEKKPNRLKQFGFTVRPSEEKVPPERPQVAFQTPVTVPSASPMNEDFHRGLASTLGEIAAPRLTPIPPPPPPVVMDNYRTPYDDAYYYYGTRNPLDPNLVYYGARMMGMQATPSQEPPLSRAPAEQSLGNIEQRNTGDTQRSIRVFSEEKTKPSKGAALSYQQALQQQIKEREERRRQEREEKERFEAKLEAERRNYNPWGRGGGGAPLKDAEGNLITNLNMMHKQNEDAYLNPEARPPEEKRAVVAVDQSLASTRPENTETSTNKIAGFTFAQTSPFARGNVFSEPLSPEHLKRQESYKNFLRLQIEEKRRREEAEREKIRLEEEREEKRLAEERMRLQKAYEEEEEEKRKKKQRLKHEAMMRLEEERKKEAEKRREKEAKREEQLKQHSEQVKVEEEKMMPSRQPSPVVPALQSKSVRAEERLPSAESRMSYYAQDPPQPRTPSPPVPARRNQLRAAEEKKNVIKELSEMRRRLQEQLQNMASDDDVPVTRGRREHPRDVFEMARLRLQVPVRRTSCREARDPINMQNIWDFNELKCKDSDSRVGVRHMYPDPPRDGQTLDIQQQALLREQQKKLDRLRTRRKIEDDLASVDEDDPASVGKPRLFRNESTEFLRNSLLESDSAFIGANGEMFPALEELNVSPQLPGSARERRQMKQEVLEWAEDGSRGQMLVLPPDGLSLHSDSSLDVNQLKGKNQERLHRLSELQQNSALQGGNTSLEEVEDIWKRSPSSDGRCPSSVDTIATEPWLRPGTSETLHRLMAEESSPAKLPPESSLPRGWHGLSTAHG